MTGRGSDPCRKPALFDDDRLNGTLVGRLLDQVFQFGRDLVNDGVGDLLAHLKHIRTSIYT